MCTIFMEGIFKMDFNTKDIALRIKQLCKDKKMSVKSVLEECSLNKSFIYDLEKRGSVPSIEAFYNLANYLDCSVDYLLGRADNYKSRTEMEQKTMENNLNRKYNKLSESQRAVLKYELYNKLIDSYKDELFFNRDEFKCVFGGDTPLNIVGWFQTAIDYSLEASGDLSKMLKGVFDINCVSLNDDAAVDFIIGNKIIGIDKLTAQKFSIAIPEYCARDDLHATFLISERELFDKLAGINVATLEYVANELYKQMTFGGSTIYSDLQHEVIAAINSKIQV